MLLCSAALVLSVGTRIVSDRPVACPAPQWLPVLLASTSHDAPATRRRMEDAINPGCTAHYSVTEGVSSLPDAASMMPAYVTLNGSQIGYPADGTTQETSCDQIAAVAVGTSSVRGTSSFIEQGYSVTTYMARPRLPPRAPLPPAARQPPRASGLASGCPRAGAIPRHEEERDGLGESGSCLPRSPNGAVGKPSSHSRYMRYCECHRARGACAPC